jgi:hypothetical protein
MSASQPCRASTPALRAYWCDGSGQLVSAGAVAAGAECEAFRLWVDGLTPSGVGALVQLRHYGFTYDLAALAAELQGALGGGPAGPLTRLVGQRLLALLAGHPEAACFLLEGSADAVPARGRRAGVLAGHTHLEDA